MGILVRKRAPVGSRSLLSSTPASSKPSPKLRKVMWWRSRWCQMVPFSNCSSGCTEESLPAKSRRPGAAVRRKSFFCSPSSEGDVVAIQVVPDGAVLQLLFGMHRGIAAREKQAARRGGQAEILLLLAVGRHQRTFGPGVGVRPHQPVMAVHADIAIGVKVVADGPLAGQSVVVRGDADIAYAEAPLLAVYVTPGPEAGDFGHPHGARNIAEYFIVGAIFLDDQHNVLAARRQAALRFGARAEAVGLHHEGRLGRQVRGGGQRED